MCSPSGQRKGSVTGWSLVSCLEWKFPAALAERDGTQRLGHQGSPGSQQRTTSTCRNLQRHPAEQGNPSRKTEPSEGCSDPHCHPGPTPGLPPGLPGAALGQVLQPAPRATHTSHGCHCPLQSPEEHAARHLRHPLLPASPHVGFPTKSQPRR